jgi:hypothetical protein
MMNISHCPSCKKRLIPARSDTDHTNLVCLFCDDVDPMLMTAASWAASSLARPLTDNNDQ